MKRLGLLFLLFLLFITMQAVAQQPVMTPEQLWQLGNTGFLSLTPDGKKVLYRVTHTNITDEKKTHQYFLAIPGTEVREETKILGDKTFVQWDKNGLYAKDEEGNIFISKDEGNSWQSFASGLKDASHIRIAPDGVTIAFSREVAIEKVLGKELYPQAVNSTAQVYTDLNFRHWDTWYEGKVSHLFVSLAHDVENAKDLTPGEPYDIPQKPFGGTEDFIFSPDSKWILYVSKKKSGKAYAESTNTDIYRYNIASGETGNLTEGMMGYDVHPAFSPDGKYLAFQSMARDGYEADKNDIVILHWSTLQKINITAHWDESVDGSVVWSHKGDVIYFNASIKGTKQLFAIDVKKPAINKPVKQVTSGVFDVAGIVAVTPSELIITRTDMNHAAEIFSVNTKDVSIRAVSKTNDAIYAGLALSDVQFRLVKTTDNKEMGVWVIYPPDFDPTKKYPTLLYCQGGPQAAVTQFYSMRWNFQLMAANGYIVVAPNRRGMPGWGTQWNEAISGDWGGQVMKDYLIAIDEVSKESYVDKNRLGAVGASYGGYSVFMLAGIHEGRFKSFISHCGLFDMRSWYGTTEEMFFANFDLKGAYWDNPVPEAYARFNPSEYVNKWNTPIMIIQGGLDFRVPTEQGLQAFKAAQLKGIKSKFLYFPNENHWVSKPHNALIWQHEFFKWLKETL